MSIADLVNHFQMKKHAKMLLPSVIPTDGAIYVNAQQFNGIVRRRLARAKAGREKVSRNRKVRKRDLPPARVTVTSLHSPCCSRTVTSRATSTRCAVRGAVAAASFPRISPVSKPYRSQWPAASEHQHAPEL